MKLRIRHDAVTVWTTLCTVTSRLGIARSSGVMGLLTLALVTNLSGCWQKPRSPPAESSSHHGPATSIMVFAALPLKIPLPLLAGNHQTDIPAAKVDVVLS